MRRTTVFVAAAVGLLFPLGLALAVYVASAASLDEPAGVRVGSQPLGRVTVTTDVRTATAPTTTDATTTDHDDDRSGKCDEPEHRSDPDCVGPGASTEDDSGRGRGRGRGGDDSDSSGSGSDSSGSGSGGDD